MDASVHVIRTEQNTLPGAGGQLVKGWRVFYNVGDDGPFYEDFTEVQFTKEEVHKRLDNKAVVLKAIRNPQVKT